MKCLTESQAVFYSWIFAAWRSKLIDVLEVHHALERAEGKARRLVDRAWAISVAPYRCWRSELRKVK